MDRSELYDKITERKAKPKDLDPYTGGNGRVDKCVKLFRQGKLRGGDILVDVGGAIGDLGYAVRDMFKRRIVIDISDGHREAAEAKGNEFIEADIDADGLPLNATKNSMEMLDVLAERAPGLREIYPDGVPCGMQDEVDVITALDFIEHIIDPESFARDCFRVLKKGGQVFVNTPNIRFWPHIEELITRGTFPHTSGDREVFHGGHLAFYTYGDLCTIFGSAGFRKFEMVMDEEGYRAPPPYVLPGMIKPANQMEYKQLSMEFGCPNLLFICEKL